MSSYTLKTRSLPLHDSFDVIVAGGGPAGCTAATAAAQEGARTLLIEATGSLGGMGTSGLVPAWCPFSDKEKIIYRGLAQKVFNAAKAAMPHVKADALDWVPIDPEALKRIYDDLVISSGSTVLFNTMLCGVEVEQGRVDAIIVANKSGLSAYRGKVYIDCTGDADLAAWAGAEFHKADQTAELMPASLCFILGNVDEYAYRHGPQIRRKNPENPILKILKSGKYPLIPDAHVNNELIGPGTVGFNAGHLWDVDNTDPVSVSKALVLGRKMAAAFRDALAEFVPAFASSFLVCTASLMGIRETRRIVGDYVLSLEDYLQRRSFADEICRNSYYIDVHPGPKASGQTGEHHYGKGESHGIPYRCLIPKGLKNVLVAGRAISCQRQVQGSVRVMPTCLCMGEAAGIAGAMALRSPQTDVHAMDVQQLRARLKERGAYLP